ncbi:uncharacterized protein LOC110642039 isoform X2 [Hevea brasiliensis]|uniref:uncharacterized protein LOC110642039 isoform X2 n=1 Tax=Hevea brasiliensis TaxID=3981 RepID=UPI0025D5DD27|nr:uncharacterized protein LOC110642039 isoform X2 [Hevea brasiliensis]
MDSCPDLYPLTSLQIGDIKSNLSQAFLYFAPISHKFLILVDNQSWWRSKHSRSKCIRELMIAKYRVSPFKNTRALRRRPSLVYQSSSHGKKKFLKWLPNVSMASVSERAPFSMMNLYKALHGFIVFEVAWKDVWGINYLNELQTDTSLALEVKSLRKWEFNGIDQALSCISLWFSSTPTEAQTLWSSLIFLYYKVSSPSSLGITVASKDLLFNVSQAELFSEDAFFDVRECPIETNDKFCMDNQVGEPMIGKRKENLWEDSSFEPMEYKHTFLLFGFNDKNLPFQLNQIITSDLKLLTLLEAGLPSWVIFLQSYPFFNRVYRPWMRPLLRILYVVISSITVIIGFYDLYKNVPLLKAAASHLSWPFFKWIEACDMISRIRYLGTMLFLHNFEKAVRLFLMKTHVMKLSVLLLTRHLIHPLEHLVGFVVPIWSTFTEIGEKICMIARVVVQPLSNILLDFAKVLFSPLELLYSFILNLGTFISSLFNIIWGLLLIPSQGCLHLAKHVSSILLNIYEVLARAFMVFTNRKGLLLRFVQVKPSSSDMSFWHSVWNELFSKVFRSLKNIISVLVTFLTSCNRHRLSIHNYFKAALQQRYDLFRLAHLQCSCRSVPQLESHHKQVGIKRHENCR